MSIVIRCWIYAPPPYPKKNSFALFFRSPRVPLFLSSDAIGSVRAKKISMLFICKCIFHWPTAIKNATYHFFTFSQNLTLSSMSHDGYWILLRFLSTHAQCLVSDNKWAYIHFCLCVLHEHHVKYVAENDKYSRNHAIVSFGCVFAVCWSPHGILVCVCVYAEPFYDDC